MRLYESKELVRVECQDCAGCSACCQGMGDTIRLDPLDICLLTQRLHRSMEQLLNSCIALHVEEGLLLPHMQMQGSRECCPFLNEQGRCSIHPFRPGLCRTFPLGRNYADGKLTYFPVEGGCVRKNRSKVRVEDWIGVSDFGKYERFLIRWHELTKTLRRELASAAEDEQRSINLSFLKCFYVQPYTEETDFHTQFEQRCLQFRTEQETRGRKV